METVAYLLVWALLFMVMMRFGCGAHVMGHRHHGHHGNHGDQSDRISQPAQAVDPVCGMTVATAGAKSTVFGGKAWFFCSPACRDKFEAAPQQYAKPDTAPTAGEPHHAA
jgi:YHS domain-containing protein